MIETKGLNKSFGSVQAVNQLNLSIKAGEIYGLVGSDGAGKTTTLRLLVGALHPDSGQITICGFVLDKQVEQARARIGYLSQRFSLYEDLTVLENIRFFAEVRGLSPADWRPRSLEILEFVGLAAFKDRNAGLLSGGMKQKLGLASALVTQPSVLLLDEPTTGVDPVTRQDFWQLLVKLVAHPAQVAVLITTPYMDEATRCNRIGFMQKGKLITEGTPSQLRSRLNGRILELRGNPLRNIRNLVSAEMDVEDVRLFGDQLHLRTIPGKSAEVIKHLETSIPAAGYKIDSIRQIPANLEDVFILLSEQEVTPNQEKLELPEAHTQALITLLERIPPEKFNWVLTGSASLRLQGMDIPVHDLDIECNSLDIRNIEQAIFEFITTPVHLWESDHIRSLDGKARINEIEIELIADLETQNSDSSWKRIIEFDQKIWRQWYGYKVPLLPLTVEMVAYKEMGHDEKALLIQETIQHMKEVDLA
ncbi:MAG: ATP-binding cassette domain-containing protein [Chloroflexota bacterium]